MKNVEEFLKDNYNYNPEVKDNLQTYFEQWKSWYKGNVTDFHNYNVYNGQQMVQQKRYTMNMAKEISEDWSDILWSEKCEISLKNEQSQASFEDLINDIDLYTIINQAIEKSGALGTCATVVKVYDIMSSEDGLTIDVTNSKVDVDIVDIDWIFPLSWNNKEVLDCAFGSIEYIDGKKHIVLSVHKRDENGIYHIYNHLFRCDNDTITEVELTNDIVDDFNTGSDVKWFSIFKPLLTNNLFSSSPFGIPHYANAIDNIKAVDISFDALKNEIKDGRRRTFVSADLLTYEDGTQKLTFDKNDLTVYVLPKGANKDDLIQSDTDTLRTDKQIETLNTNLNILGNKVGFGENHYHFDGTNLSTATAVVSSNSKLFRRKKKLEIGYESSIYDLVKALCFASTSYGTANIISEDMVIKFDDSIIEDKEAESVRAFREVNAGIMSKQEYREKIFGETPEIAQQKIAEVIEAEPSVEDLVGTNNE